MMILMEMMLEVVFGVLVMEVDKLVDEVTNMDVDKVTNMMAMITNEDFFNILASQVRSTLIGRNRPPVQLKPLILVFFL